MFRYFHASYCMKFCLLFREEGKEGNSFIASIAFYLSLILASINYLDDQISLVEIEITTKEKDNN